MKIHNYYVCLPSYKRGDQEMGGAGTGRVIRSPGHHHHTACLWEGEEGGGSRNVHSFSPLGCTILGIFTLSFRINIDHNTDSGCFRVRYALKKKTILFGNFSQHGGRGLPKSQNFCKFTKYFFVCQIHSEVLKHVLQMGG